MINNSTKPTGKETVDKGALTAVLRVLFLMLIFSLSIAKPVLLVFGQRVQFSDLIFLATFAVWLICLASGRARFRYHRVYWLFFIYFGAMALSLSASDDLSQSLARLSGEVYLIGLAVLTFNLVRTSRAGRDVVLVWLAGTFLTVAVGLAAVALFYLLPSNQWTEFALYQYGAVPVGNYPRISSTFLSPSLLCNFLVVSLLFLYIARKSGWIKNGAFHIIHACLLITSLFTISSGLGAIPLGAAIWLWYFHRAGKPKLAKAALISGAALSIAFLGLSLIALQPYRTAPFSWQIPGTGVTLAPSSRVLVWRASLDTIIRNPLFGVGIGRDVCGVVFENTSGKNSLLTEAHNTYLNVAGQTGVPGLAAILLLTFFLLREIIPQKTADDDASILRIGIGIAFFCAFVYQGLVGSFEETRHLWILIGLAVSFGRSSVASARVNQRLSDR